MGIYKAASPLFTSPPAHECETLNVQPDEPLSLFFSTTEVWESHRNVKVRLFYDFFLFMSSGIWSVSILSTYLQRLTSQIEYVGYAEGMQGLCMAVVSIPSGYITDKFGPERVLRVSQVIGIFALAIGCFAPIYQGPYEFHFMFGSLCLWGMYSGLSNPALDANYADSTIRGFSFACPALPQSCCPLHFLLAHDSRARSMLYTVKSMTVYFASGMGPLVNSVLFYTTLDNTWTLPELRLVLLVGMVLSIVPIVTTSLIHRRVEPVLDEDSPDWEVSKTDDQHSQSGLSSAPESGRSSPRSYHDESEDVTDRLLPSGGIWGRVDRSEDGRPWSEVAPRNRDINALLMGDDDVNGDLESGRLGEIGEHEEVDFVAEEPLEQKAFLQHAMSSQNISEIPYNERRAEWHERAFFCWYMDTKWVPRFILIADMIASLASGMTIKFFPLFFVNETNLSPVQVNAIYVANPFLLCCVTWLAQKFSRRIGRIQTSVSFRSCGICLLLLMALERAWWTVPEIIVPIFIVRTVLMNATGQLSRSVSMDFIKKEDRAKWSAMNSVSQFGWSGSAVVGGLLIGKLGYGDTFFVTAGMQAIATLIYCCIIPLVPRKENTLLAPPAPRWVGAHWNAGNHAAISGNSSPVGSSRSIRVDLLTQDTSQPSPSHSLSSGVGRWGRL